MADSFKVKNRLNISPKNTASSVAGDIRVDSTDNNKLKFHNGTDEAVIPRVDQLDLMEYDNAGSGLAASNPQAAIDEVQANVATVETDLATLDTAVDTVIADLDAAEADIDTLQADVLQAQTDITDLQTDVANFDANLAADTSLDLATSNTASTVNIGTGTNTNTINIGGANTTINMTGTVNNQNVTNLDVDDKLITINKGGAAASGAVAGIELEENGSATGRITTSADRNSWEFKAPNTAGVTTLTPGTGSDSVVLAAATQDLSNKTFTDALTLDGQASTPSNPSAGDYKVYIKDEDGRAYILNSDGEEIALGSGSGQGGINFIQNADAVTNTDGWTTYADAAAATPVDGTGGSPNVTFTITTATNEVLREYSTDSGSFKLSKDAANRQGEGVAYALNVDRTDVSGKRLIVSFDYQTSLNYLSNDIRVFAYVTSGDPKVINVLNSDSGNIIATSGFAGGKFVGSFETDTVSGSSSYRLIFHIASTNANAYDLIIDNVKVTPDTVVPGAIVTPWGQTAWTPTGSWVSNATYLGKYRRVGDTLEAEVRVATSGAPTAATFTVSLPSGLTIDTAKLAGAGANVDEVLGVAAARDAGTANYAGVVKYNDSTSVLIAGDAGVWANNIPFTFGAGDFLTLRFSVPISNWNVGASLSNSEAVFQTPAVYANGDPASASAGNPIIFPSKSYDVTGSYSTSTGRFTAPSAGRYHVHGWIRSVTGSVRELNVYVNAVSRVFAGDIGANANDSFDATVSVNAGDLIDIRPDGALDAASGSSLFIEKLPDFSVFSTYGTFELKTASSAQKTPGGSGHYHALSNNTISLTPGTWKLSASAQFGNSGTPAYSLVGVGIMGANGADSTTEPAVLSTVATILSANASASATSGLQVLLPVSGGNNVVSTGEIIVRVTANTTVYVVTYAVMTTAAQARINAYMNAERLQ